MKFKHFNYAAIVQMLVIVLVVSSCSKSNDPVTPHKPPVSPPVTTVTYNYASLADSLQTATYQTFISIDGNYFIQNNSGTTTFKYWPNPNKLDV